MSYTMVLGTARFSMASEMLWDQLPTLTPLREGGSS